MQNRFYTIAAVLFFLAAVETPGLALGASPEPAEDAKEIIVFAASSLGVAIEEIAAGFGQRQDLNIRVAIASSSALARQIENGAPADIFISADQRWIHHLADQYQLSDKDMFPLALNHLVVATTDAGPAAMQTAKQALLQDPLGWVAVGDPDLSPLGDYTREALRDMRIEAQLSGRLAYAADARATLALLRTGAAPISVLYESDAKLAPGIRIIARIEPTAHRPIVYFGVMIRNTSAAHDFIRELLNADSGKILQRNGFELPAGAIKGE